jgi:hypothetical protein
VFWGCAALTAIIGIIIHVGSFDGLAFFPFLLIFSGPFYGLLILARSFVMLDLLVLAFSGACLAWLLVSKKKALKDDTPVIVLQ